VAQAADHQLAHGAGIGVEASVRLLGDLGLAVPPRGQRPTADTSPATRLSSRLGRVATSRRSARGSVVRRGRPRAA
jgi:hypothetical protein